MLQKEFSSFRYCCCFSLFPFSVFFFSLSSFHLPSVNAFCLQVNDLTQEVTEIRREVSSVLEHPLTEDTTFVKNYLNTEPLTRDSAVQVLVEKLCSRDLDRSIHLLRAFREKFGGEVFGISDEDNLDSLVSFYCKHVAEKNVGSLVMSGPIQNFAALCRNLMEVNVAILAAVEDLNI